MNDHDEFLARVENLKRALDALRPYLPKNGGRSETHERSKGSK